MLKVRMEPSSPDFQLMKQSQVVASQKNSNWFFIFVLIILAFLTGVGAMYAWQKYPDLELFKPLKLFIKPQTEKGCTLEAKICPDGSTVGRVPPTCEFTACSSVKPSITPIISPTPSVIFSPKPKASSQINYEPGVVLVTFKEGTTYKQAKDLISSFGFQIEKTNSYWIATNFQPNNSTVLKTVDLFKINVGVGNEDKIIDQLNGNSLIRVATKNSMLYIDK